MLAETQINRIAARVAAERLPPDAVMQVTTHADIGTDDEEILRVLVVLRESAFAQVTGEQMVNALSDLQDQLRAAGESRFASIEYATDAELALHGGS